MGTRADFYVGRGLSAEWIGSIAWDGYPDGIPETIKKARNEKDFREAVASFIVEDRDDGTRPEDGWPWPWETSHTTDYAYAFDGANTWACCFGSEWWDAALPEPEKRGKGDTVFPDMSSRKRVAYGARSGTIMIVAK